MTDVSATKRMLTTVVAVATILWSVGFASMLAPLSARAESYSAGDVIRGTTLSTVYYYGSDGQRYAFPNEKTYFTWYENFNGVKTITDSELAGVSLAGNIVYRPGSRWIKIQSDPKTYAVSPSGMLHWIESEEVALGLAGSNWNQMIDDVPDVFFVDYAVGASLMTAEDAFDGALVLVNGVQYLILDGEARTVTSSGASANGYQSRFWLDGTDIDISGYTEGEDVDSEESALTDSAQLGGESEVVAGSGDLSVSLASDTPASQTIPEGAASVEMTKLKFTAASNEDVVITEVIAHLGGIGSSSNISKVYLYEGDDRLTKGKSVNSSTFDAIFSGLSLSIDAGESRYFTIRADMSSTVNGGDEASLGIDAASDVAGPDSVSGSFPIKGNEMSLSGTHGGTFTVYKNGTIDNPRIGESDATIGKFKVSASSTEGGYLHTITLDINKASDHSDFKLWDSDVLVADGEAIGGDSVRFSFDSPFWIKDGNNNIFTVTADVGGDASDNVKVAIEEEADVEAYGDKYGFNLAVDIGKDSGDSGSYSSTGGTCASSSNECSFSTVEGGQLTFVDNSEPAHDVAIDSEDQVFAIYTVTAANWTSLEEMDLIVACDTSGTTGCNSTSDTGDLLNSTEADANLTDITFRLEDGTIFMGPEELTVSGGSDTTQTLSYTDSQTLSDGESIDLYVTADVSSNAVSGDVFKVTLDMSGVSAEDENGDALSSSDIIPTADLTADNITLASSSLTVKVAEPPSSSTYVIGSDNVESVGFSFEAGDASDVRLTDLTVQAYGDNDGSLSGTESKDITVRNYVESCSFYDSESGALVAGPESPNSSDQLVFDDFGYDIAAGEVVKLILECSYSNAAVNSGTNDIYWFQISAAASITSEDEDGDSITATLSSGNDTPSVAITITSAGSVTVAAAGDMPSADIILGSSTSLHVGSFKITAATEDFKVDRLNFRNCLPASTTTPTVTSTCTAALGTDTIASAVKMSYTNDDGETQTQTAYLSSGKLVFKNIDGLTVGSGTSKVVSLWIDTNNVNTSTGATSGNTIKMNLACLADETTEDDCKFIGSGSGVIKDTDDVATFVLANVMTVRKTKPTISKASGSPTGASSPGTSQEVLRLNVSADSRGYVTLDQLLFQVDATDNATTPSKWDNCGDGSSAELAAATKWKFYDLDDPSQELDDSSDWTFRESDGSACTSTEDVDLAYAYLNLNGSSTTGPEEISAGTTKTYVLAMDTTGLSTSTDDSVTVSIPSETTADALSTALNACQWDDDNTSATGGTDIECDYIDNLPISGGTLTY